MPNEEPKGILVVEREAKEAASGKFELTGEDRDNLRELSTYYGVSELSVMSILLSEEVQRERLTKRGTFPVRWRRYNETDRPASTHTYKPENN